jgi:hypothetical protein
MLALTFTGLQQIAATEVPKPVVQQATDAIVKVTLCGICGRWADTARVTLDLRISNLQRGWIAPYMQTTSLAAAIWSRT